MGRRSHSPIGIFDSGLGGLTVVREISHLLPYEKLIYVGDTARVPYGTKSPETIRRYASQIAFFLLKKKVKAIVVACNSASAVALTTLRQFPIPVLGVIEPGVRAAKENTKKNKVGVIGTHATVSSHAYKIALNKNHPRIQVWEQACPLFVPLVEEGRLQGKIPDLVALDYLRFFRKVDIDSLVLGCTHYPLLKKTIQKAVGPKIKLIDSAHETARALNNLLRMKNLLNPSRARVSPTFFTTDRPKNFSQLSLRFLGRSVYPARFLSLDNL
ncbi:glutamate racemase [bacterium F11]|nr:glutamate racemase [bacterium F11]